MSGLTPPKKKIGDDWAQKYDQAYERARLVQDGLQERAQLMRQGQQPAKLNASLRHNVGTLSTEIEQLEVALDGPQCASLTKQEKSRRRDLLSVLRMRRNQMRKQLAETPQAEGRSALLGTAGASTSDRADQRSGPAQETEETVGLKAAELLQLQDRLLEDQDEELGLLGEGVRRVRVVATTINDELREQNQILQGIDEEADGVHSRLRLARKQVAAVLQKGSNWRMVLLMILLIMLLVGIVVSLVKK